MQRYLGNDKSINILDIGCGRRYPFTLLLHSAGYKVTGIDTLYVNPNASLIRQSLDNLRYNGPSIFGKTLMDFIGRGTAKSYKQTQEISGINLNWKGINVLKMNAESMNFQNESFDSIISIFVLEHLLNLGEVINEMDRVLRRKGIAILAIDLFASKYGSHWPQSQRTKKIAWRHLIDEDMYIPGGLNKLRENDFISVLTKKFKMLELIRQIDEENKKMLTIELREKLNRYSEEELLTDTLILVLQKE